MLMMSHELLIRHLEESVLLFIIHSLTFRKYFFSASGMVSLHGRCSVSFW